MFNNRRRKVKTAIVAILLATASIASASAQERNPTLEYRIWSAEQMINRIAEKAARATNVCGKAEPWAPRLSEKCVASVAAAYPVIEIIRAVARSGDEVRWAYIVDVVHKFEREIEAPLNRLERN
jgi:hypothetical protein